MSRVVHVSKGKFGGEDPVNLDECTGRAIVDPFWSLGENNSWMDHRTPGDGDDPDDPFWQRGPAPIAIDCRIPGEGRIEYWVTPDGRWFRHYFRPQWAEFFEDGWQLITRGGRLLAEKPGRILGEMLDTGMIEIWEFIDKPTVAQELYRGRYEDWSPDKQWLLDGAPSDGGGAARSGQGEATGAAAEPVEIGPRLDDLKKTLYFGQVVCRKFTRRVSNQYELVRAFQEAGWPASIENPFLDDQKRPDPDKLDETIGSLKDSLEEGSPITFGIEFGRAGWRKTCEP